MENDELDVQLWRVTAELIESAPQAHAFDDVVAWGDASARPVDDRSARPARVLIAVGAAAAIVAVVVGFVVVGSGARNDTLSTSDTASTSPDGAAPDDAERVEPTPATQLAGFVNSGAVVDGAGRPLSDVDQLSREEWVVPARMLDGYPYQFASRDGPFQSVNFGPQGDDDAQITVGISGHDFGVPADFEAIDIAGATWNVQRSGEFWNAQRLVGSAVVGVSGRGLDNDTGAAVIESLLVVSAQEMTVRPLAGPNEHVEVASFEGVDGSTITLSADEVNGWYCLSTRSSDGAGVSCGTPFDPSDTLSWEGSGGMSYAEGSPTVEVTTSGIVSSDVDLVEVELFDGTVVTVEPTDTSGEFGVKFYTVAAVANVGEGSADSIVWAVSEVRGFDADGELLATRRPEDRFGSGSTSGPENDVSVETTLPD